MQDGRRRSRGARVCLRGSGVGGGGFIISACHSCSSSGLIVKQRRTPAEQVNQVASVAQLALCCGRRRARRGRWGRGWHRGRGGSRRCRQLEVTIPCPTCLMFLLPFRTIRPNERYHPASHGRWERHIRLHRNCAICRVSARLGKWAGATTAARAVVWSTIRRQAVRGRLHFTVDEETGNDVCISHHNSVAE